MASNANAEMFKRPIFFAPNNSDACCLCGLSDNLSGEHKIKASALRAEFADNEMVIGNFSFDSGGGWKYLQSPKSKALQFSARMCAKCNGSRTQPADREFDHLHSLASRLMGEGKDPTLVFQNKRYIKGTNPYLNFFRYFAKLLCCQLAELGAPRPIHMSQFAIGKTNTNCVWLRIGQDWTYQQFSPVIGQHPYAAHGGLAVYGDKRDNGPNAFHSTLTIGALQYIFFARLTRFERCALKIRYREFYNLCRDLVGEASVTPIPTEKQWQLGIVPHEIECGGYE